MSLNFPPMNLPPEAVPWGRYAQDQINGLDRQASSASNNSELQSKANAGTLNAIQQQILVIQQTQATLATQQATLAAQQITLNNTVSGLSTAVSNIAAQQAYLSALQPSYSATSTGNNNVAAGSWGGIRPGVSLGTQSGGQIQITVSAYLFAPSGGAIYGTYSISGATTVTRASRVSGNEIYNTLGVLGTAMAASKTWIVNVAANANISVFAEFYSDPGNSVTAAYAYPSISVQNVS